MTDRLSFRLIPSLPLSIRRFKHWEYWPMWVTNLPVAAIWLLQSFRAGHLLFFSAVNPSIPTGGMFGESKMAILKQIPAHLHPVTVFCARGTSRSDLFSKVRRSGMHYPLLCKPDVGERGMLVQKIEGPQDLERYHQEHQLDFLVQEYVDYPLELSVLYHRFPGAAGGQVTSVCQKQFLVIYGDGKQTVRELMAQDLRAVLQADRLEASGFGRLDDIPAPGEEVLLEPIGNHSRGTKFLNAAYLIDEELTAVFDRVSRQFKGIHYGRFDLRCPDADGLKKGIFKVLEFNGVAGEPAHIYDPSIPIWSKYREVFRHWDILLRIYREQKRRGVRPMSFGQAIRDLGRYFAYVRAAKSS